MTDKHVDAFLALSAARLAPKTVDAYKRDLADVTAFLQASPAGASPDRLAEYIAHMRARGLAATTIARRIAALRSFYTHQMLIGVRPVSRGRRLHDASPHCAPSTATRCCSARAATTPPQSSSCRDAHARCRARSRPAKPSG
jgi:site-specific recombinase XerD